MPKFRTKEENDRIKNQVGCGYCSHEKTCDKYEPRVNKAKQGCTDFLHFELDENYPKKDSFNPYTDNPTDWQSTDSEKRFFNPLKD